MEEEVKLEEFSLEIPERLEIKPIDHITEDDNVL